MGRGVRHAEGRRPAAHAGPLLALLKDGGTLGSMVGGLVLIGLVAGLAAYLCSLDYRRTVAVSETRREECLAIAADLHDFVAHHVTTILVPPGS